jgi:phage baseplate assembly protein W
MAADPLKKDLRLLFRPDGEVDLALGREDLETVDGRDNLAQALKMRLLVGAGELGALGHPRYGSRIQELIGEPLDPANLGLLRRFVRKALMRDPRVEEVTRVDVLPRKDAPGTVAVEAEVRPGAGGQVQVSVELDVG